MTNILVIDGVVFSCPILSISNTLDSLHKYAERTEDGVLHKETIGWYRNYHVEVGFMTDIQSYKSLVEKISEPVEFHNVSVPYLDSMTPSYEAYFAGIEHSLKRVKGNQNYWYGLAFDIIARRPFK
ncbi:MAG: hypothetical protein ACOX8S_12435 [Christensenellales bacterium]|jgi:hypothetical protein